jgi:hypothetical protein
MIGAPSRLRLTRKAAALTRVLPTLDLRVVRTTSCGGSGTVHCLIVQAELLKLQKKRSVSRGVCKNIRHTNSLCSLPDVLAIVGIKQIESGGLLL